MPENNPATHRLINKISLADTSPSIYCDKLSLSTVIQMLKLRQFVLSSNNAHCLIIFYKDTKYQLHRKISSYFCMISFISVKYPGHHRRLRRSLV